MFIDVGCPPMRLPEAIDGGYPWGVRAKVCGAKQEELHGGFPTKYAAVERQQELIGNAEYEYAVVVKIETPEQM